MAENNLPPIQSTHPAILAVLAALIYGDLAEFEAIEQLKMLRAESWLIDSVRNIETMFAPRDCDYCGPMDRTLRKIRGAA